MKLIPTIVLCTLLSACQIPLQGVEPTSDGNADSRQNNSPDTQANNPSDAVAENEGQVDNQVSDFIVEAIDGEVVAQYECAAAVAAELSQCSENLAELMASQAQRLPVAEAKELVHHQDKLVIGRVEYVQLNPSEQVLKARIDTGAGLSSLNAVDLVQFQRDGKNWVRFNIIDPKTKKPISFEKKVKRFVTIKQLSGNDQRRPIIVMGLELGSIKEQVELTLADRSGYVYQLLIGRNFLRDRAVVDVSHKYTTQTAE